MSFKIIVSPIAQKDLETAYLYYKNEANIKIAKKFLKAIKDVYKTLKLNPFYQLKTKDYRAYPIKKFPYIIVFQIDENLSTIVILSVFNTYQNPIKYQH